MSLARFCRAFRISGGGAGFEPPQYVTDGLDAAFLVVTANLVQNSDAGRNEVLKRVLAATKDAKGTGLATVSMSCTL